MLELNVGLLARLLQGEGKKIWMCWHRQLIRGVLLPHQPLKRACCDNQVVSGGPVDFLLLYVVFKARHLIPRVFLRKELHFLPLLSLHLNHFLLFYLVEYLVGEGYSLAYTL